MNLFMMLIFGNKTLHNRQPTHISALGIINEMNYIALDTNTWIYIANGIYN